MRAKRPGLLAVAAGAAANSLRRRPLLSALRLLLLASFLFMALTLLRLPSPRRSSPPFFGVGKIAFLFLVKSDVPLDFLWDAFFRNGDDAKFSVYVHSNPGFVLEESTTRSAFFYGKHLPRSVKVEWGGSSMIEAERLLLAAALEDHANQRFVLLSDSCIPLHNFSFIYHYMMSSSKSFVDSFLDEKEGRYNAKMAPYIPQEKWRKGSQWVTLVRKHAEVVVADHLVFSVFRKHCKRHRGTGNVNMKRRRSLELKRLRIFASLAAQTGHEHDCIPDEHYVQTIFSVNKLEDEQEKRTLTYTLWNQSSDHKDINSWHPKTFEDADANFKEINEIKAIDNVNYETEHRTEWCKSNGTSVPCFLFARKFSPGAAMRLLREGHITASVDTADSFTRPSLNDQTLIM